MSPNASSLTGTGNHSPYFVGDKVYVSFLYGDASRPVIVGRIHEQEGLAESLALEGSPVLPVGTRLESGRTVRPGPLASRPEGLNSLGLVSIETKPMLLIS
jgi:hypothetical protein